MAPRQPKSAFGLKYSQHRCFLMRPVLKYYKKRVSSCKEKQFEHLVSLAVELRTEEAEAIQHWFREQKLNSHPNDEKLYRNLDSLRALRGIKGRLEEKDPILKTSSKLKECEVCLDSVAEKDFPQQKVTSSCAHELMVCNKCVTRSVDTQVQEVDWDHVECPQCDQNLEYEVVKQWASPRIFESYEKKVLRDTTRQMPNFMMCLRPGCDSGQIHEGGDAQPIMTCTACKYKSCWTHQMPWHSGQTCDEYEVERKERVAQEAASKKFLDEKTKVCPNIKCGLHVEKISGCDHMTCHKCKFAFCWICLAPWIPIVTKGNTFHATTCKWHSNNLPNAPRNLAIAAEVPALYTPLTLNLNRFHRRLPTVNNAPANMTTTTAVAPRTVVRLPDLRDT